jgi:ATP-dependent DNA helicase RecQ
MKRTGELFGAHHIIEILRGANSEKVISKGHNKLTTYGIGKNLTKEQWLSLSKQFIQYDIISKDLQHGSLKVSKNGYDVLKNRRKIYGRMAVKEPKLTAKKSYANAYDEELFEVLRKLRKGLADKNGVPPYVVFHDRTLAEMATYLPTNGEDFKKLSGVGNRKLNKYGKTFIKAISDYVGDKNIESRTTAKSKKSDKPKRYEMVGEDFNNGKSLDVLEEDYQVKLDTLINHLHRYLKSGNKLENDHLDEHIKLGEKLQSKILKIFEREGIRYLTPVKEELDEEVDYIQLKLMRLKFLND